MRASILSLLLLGCLLLAGCQRKALPPLNVAYWHWHSDMWRDDPQITKSLQKANMNHLFVRCASVRMIDGQPMAVSHVNWGYDVTPGNVTLVFRLEETVVKDFEKVDPEVLVNLLVESWKEHRERAKDLGNQVKGVQIDFDCPTRLLPRYGELLRRLRQDLPQGWELSIGALPTWFIDGKAGPLLPHVDYLAAQFYEGGYGRTLDTYQPIASLDQIEQGIKAIEKSGKPYWAGVAAYGRGILYDEEGTFIRPIASPGPEELLTRPSTRIISQRKQGLSSILVLEIKGEDGTPRKVLCDLPTGQSLYEQAQAVEKLRSKNCRGLLIFRFPEEKEQYVLPVPEAIHAIRRPPQPAKGLLRVNAALSPYELIETSGSDNRPYHLVNLSLVNTVYSRSTFGEKAVYVEVNLQPGQSVVSILPGTPGMRLEALAGGKTSSLGRADRIRFYWLYLPSGGERKVSMVLQAPDKTSVKVKTHIEQYMNAKPDEQEVSLALSR